MKVDCHECGLQMSHAARGVYWCPFCGCLSFKNGFGAEYKLSPVTAAATEFRQMASDKYRLEKVEA